MSLILDALRRAERERQPGPARVLADPDLPDRPARSSRFPRLALIVVVLAAIGAGAWWFVSGRPEPRQVTPPPAQEDARPKQRAILQVQPPQARQPQPAVIPGTESVASLDELAPDEQMEASPAPDATADEPRRKMPEPPPEVRARIEEHEAAGPRDADEGKPRAEKDDPTAEPPADTEAVSAAEPAEQAPLPKALTQPAPVRRFKEMPVDYRSDFPKLRIDIHVYEKDPKRSFVLLNGLKYRNGDRISEGPVIVEIVADGIVFDYRGQKVLYPL